MAKDKGHRPVHNIVQVAIPYNNNNNNNNNNFFFLKIFWVFTILRHTYSLPGDYDTAHIHYIHLFCFSIFRVFCFLFTSTKLPVCKFITVCVLLF